MCQIQDRITESIAFRKAEFSPAEHQRLYPAGQNRCAFTA